MRLKTVGTKIVSFWGKGGTGKTTIAAATALGLEEAGYDVFVFSSDPAPTLCLALGVGSCLDKRARIGRIEALELSEETVLRLWKERFGGEVYEVISAFLPVGREIIDYVAGAPGISDQFLMYYVYEIWKSGGYDYIVWDTPAAGGSLRMLRIEYELYQHMTEAAKLYLRVKGALEKLRRRASTKTPDKLIEEWKELAKTILDMLASEEHMLHITTTADILGLAVTKKLYNEFSMHNIRVRRVIANMVLGEKRGCLESFEELAEEQKIVLSELERLFGETVCRIPLLEWRPRGKEALLKLWSLLEKNKCVLF